MPRPCVVAIAGVAGSGKTTLGRALAAHLSAPLIDLDSVTNPLLDRLHIGGTEGHWLSSARASEIRDARYAALRATARDVVGTAGSAVLVAPFTAELAGGPEWSDLRDAVAPAPLVVVRLVGDPALFSDRRSMRGEDRDAHRGVDTDAVIGIDTHAVDAELTTRQQLARLLPLLGCRTFADAADPFFGRTFDAVLFDLDGTLVDSTASVLRSWRRLAGEFGVSMQALHENHGQPAATLIGRVLPPERRATALERITALEVGDAHGLVPVRGASEFYAAVPAGRRAIVTSGSVPIATSRLAAAGFAPPKVFVTVEDVSRGKPDPEPYLVAAKRLGVDPARCLVVEDAAAGVRAGRAAGCRVLAVAGTVDAEELADADLVVDALDMLEVVDDEVGLRVRQRLE
jgi:sugar-phosphatase